MRVFMTGASGFIGSAVVPELLGAGHTVVGLARSDASARTIEAAGAEVLRGDLEDLEALRAGAASSDGAIHLGFVHDFTNFMASVRIDRVAIETLAGALEGTNRPLLVASGVLGLGLAPGRVATERDRPVDGAALLPRTANVEAALAAASRGVRPVALRFAPSVHGPGDHGFMAYIIATARRKGVSGYIGDGANRWPAVHRLDAAQVVRLAFESPQAGTAVHAVADEGIPIRTLAEVIGRHLDVPAVSIAPENAAEHFGWMAGFLGMDAPVSSALTRERLGWKPTHPGLIADLEAGHYFAAPAPETAQVS